MQEKYNKPDGQKDLTEAEVGPSCSWLHLLFVLRNWALWSFIFMIVFNVVRQ